VCRLTPIRHLGERPEPLPPMCAARSTIYTTEWRDSEGNAPRKHKHFQIRKDDRGGMPMRKAKPPPPSARFRYVRTVAHELGLRFRLGGRGLPGSPHLVFPAHALALFVCDCAAYGHACQPPRVVHPRCYYETQRRLHRSDLSIYLNVLGHRGWHADVIFDCATTDRLSLETDLLALTRG